MVLVNFTKTPFMKKYSFIAVLSLAAFISSCSKSNDNLTTTPTTQRTNPEARKQEGTKLLGQSTNENGQIHWTTIFYIDNSSLISKVIDSSMDVVDLNALPVEEDVSSFTYNNAGKVDHVIATSSTYTTTYTFLYNTAGNVVKITGSSAGNIFYTYDQSGNIISDSSFSFTTNDYESVLHWTYDANNNKTVEEEWQYDAGSSHLVKLATTTLVYDDKLTPNSGISPNTFWYRAAPHNILSFTSTSAGSGNVYTTNYTNNYNSFGLLKDQTRYPPSGIVAPTVKFYYY